jgi:non-lysosomal glucosylceramidase
MFVGGLWLAALRSMQELTARSGFTAEAVHYGRMFQVASASYDELLWNGEYYRQATEGEAFDFGDGCLADQLLGQWWAHQLDLGYLLPADHVRAALESIVRNNLRDGFSGFAHGYRVFADRDDSGLLVCTWPRGGRPGVPIRYADEVWTGVEYQVAAHCMFEGMTNHGLRLLHAVQGRYDGSRRNPYNEIECGDHYSRAMAGLSVLEACTGAWYDAWDAHLRLGRGVERYPLLAGTGWGEVRSTADTVSFRVLGGTVRISKVSLQAGEIEAMHVDAAQVAADVLAKPLTIATGSQLTVTLRS